MEDIKKELTEVNAILTVTTEKLITLREWDGDPSEVLKGEQVVRDLQEQLDKSHDVAEWTTNKLWKDIELEVMRSKKLRDELHAEYARELSMRDNLVQLLKRRVAELEKQAKPGGGRCQLSFTAEQTLCDQ